LPVEAKVETHIEEAGRMLGTFEIAADPVKPIGNA
jgi:hypothetical protein